MSQTTLRTQLHAIQSRWWFLGIAAGLAWTIFVTVVFLLFGGWLDLVWELSPGGRIAFVVAAILLGIAFFAAVILRLAHHARLPLLARRVDHAMGFGGAVLTGCELEERLNSATNVLHSSRYTKSPETSADMARMAIEHASKLAASAIPEKAVPAREVKNATLFLVAFFAVLVILAAFMPEMMRTQWNRFAHPYDDIPQFSGAVIEIEDPEKTVVYGDPLDIRAAVRGEVVDSLVLVIEDSTGHTETLPMFPEPDSWWRANLAKVTENALYHVRAHRTRSTKHTIEVITVPRIEEVRFRVIPPEYTRRNVYDGPLLKEGISALPNTKVEVRAKSNRPLSRGEITVTSRNPNDTTHTVTKIPMLPNASGDSEVHGEFIVTGDGKFELQLFDIHEQGSRESFAGGITLLHDQRPMVRIMRPPPQSLATPSVVVPVQVYAEDDYGISQVQLFRSLNDSRFLASPLPLSSDSSPLKRFHGQVDLSLPEYDLQPGDTIKLFARVEDNDPAGAKGAESSVVLIEIISQQEFEEMLRAKNGMELMLSRYREALRRLEAAKEELEKLHEKMEQLDPDEPVSDEIRRELERLEQRMKQETEAIQKLAENPLPYDLDKELSEELKKAAELTREAAKELGELRNDKNLDNRQLQDRLKEAAEKMNAGKQAFDEATMPPLELLAMIVPLKADENRFVKLVMQQKDLAERLSSLKEKEREDDPAIKARMRELEDEQRLLQESLDALLKDIEMHAKFLPDIPELEELRAEALEFVEALRESGAEEAMSEARTALAEYSGSRGYKKAKEAAEILESFLRQCNGMGQCASNALGFRPGMPGGMSNTLQQLLRDLGMGASGSGMGSGGSGLGAQRGMGNFGLYGNLPGMAAFRDFQSGGRGNGNSRGSGQGEEGTEFDFGEGYDTNAEGTVTGTTEGAVPLRYRQAVGRYFQKILEESD